MLLAEGVRNRLAVEAAVTGAGGAALRLAGERVVGLFGGERWEGDEVDRAAGVAVAIRALADRVYAPGDVPATEEERRAFLDVVRRWVRQHRSPEPSRVEPSHGPSEPAEGRAA